LRSNTAADDHYDWLPASPRNWLDAGSPSAAPGSPGIAGQGGDESFPSRFMIASDPVGFGLVASLIVRAATLTGVIPQ
jgi:hypothetical protein